MKNKIFIALLLLTGLSLSCRKFLDVQPRSRIKSELLLSTESGYSDALTGVYTVMAKPPLYGDVLTLSVMDVLAQRYKVPVRTSPMYDVANYNYNATAGGVNVQQTLRNIWLNQYSCIANLNNILDQIDGSKQVFTGINYNLIKGEAIGLRGFLHFDLLRMFGPVLKQNPAEKAIPYRNSLSKEVQPASSATEVIDNIIKDLKEAETLLAVDPLITSQVSDMVAFDPSIRRQRFNILAVQATLARVYLYAGQKDQAYAYAMKVINSGKFNFVTGPDISDVNDCRDRLFRNELLFSLSINDLKTTTDNYFNTQPNTWENKALSNEDDVINDLYDNSSTDYRRQYLWESSSGKLLLVKFLQFTSSTPRCNWMKNLIPIERISEMYYIAAECSPSLDEATNLFNQVITHRGLDQVSTFGSEAELQNALTKEYQKEFFGEGQLFYYYKRLNFANIPGTTIPAGSAVYVFPTPTDENVN